MTKSLKKIINIKGYALDLSDDIIYQVVPKYDADAPDGFKNSRTTKYLDDQVGVNTVEAVWNEDVGIWDTGLHEGSPVLSDMDPEDRAKFIAKVVELVIKPFEKRYGEGKLDPRNIESKFWNFVNDSSFHVDLKNGKLFKSNDPQHVLQLFICIINTSIAPKELEDLPEYRSAQFCIENRDKARDVEQEKDALQIDTIGKFYTLKSNLTVLHLILNYIGLKGITTDTPEVTVNQRFKQFTENKKDGYSNQKNFLEAAEMSEEKKGMVELGVFKELQLLSKKGIVTKDRDLFVIGDMQLGGSLKIGAKLASNKASVLKEINSHLE
jgi:hypothetical protein